jgi:hypothetical protein
MESYKELPQDGDGVTNETPAAPRVSSFTDR